jgi:putative salt-induced outer membrane protein YdiY
MQLFRRVLPLLAAGVAVFAFGQDPDRIVLKNGSTIIGTVTDADGGKVTVETDFAGTLAIDQGQIESMRTQTPLRLQLADGTVLESAPLRVEDEKLVLGMPEAEEAYALADLVRVNPEPWELGKGYHWTGSLAAGLSLEDGNTDTQEFDYKGESIWTGLLDRYTLRLIGEYDEANGQKNADNWIATGKYDRFVKDRSWYWGLNTMFERDEFADTELRTTVGPYLGNVFYSEPVFSLEAEAGVAYVWEEFFVAEDQSYPAATWTLNMSSNWLGEGTRLYFLQNGTWDLQNTADVLINTTAGLTVPLFLNIEGAAEVIWKYDSGAVDNVESLDQTYRFRIGYSW